jgi:hypothetical protein
MDGRGRDRWWSTELLAPNGQLWRLGDAQTRCPYQRVPCVLDECADRAEEAAMAANSGASMVPNVASTLRRMSTRQRAILTATGSYPS